MLPFAAATTFGIAWAVMAIIDIVLFSGVIYLMFRGAYVREKLGYPDFDRSL